MRRQPTMMPGVVLIGASTGGPQALAALLTGLAPHLPAVSVCVTLHMPPDLMPIIATHIGGKCDVEARVVLEPRQLARGAIYFAPGDRSLWFERADGGFAIVPRPVKAHHYCRHGVDDMFASAAVSHGPAALGVILSGMGQDGLVGARALVEAGGVVIVQDETSSSVWGMPGAVAKANLASAILEPAALAREIAWRLSSWNRLT